MERIYIIRWDKPVLFPDGTYAHMICKLGTREEVERYARKVAKEHKVKVKVVT